MNTTKGRLHMGIHGLQSTKEKPPDTDLGDKIKTNVFFCTTVYPSTTNEGKFTPIYAENSPLYKAKEINTST